MSPLVDRIYRALETLGLYYCKKRTNVCFGQLDAWSLGPEDIKKCVGQDGSSFQCSIASLGADWVQLSQLPLVVFVNILLTPTYLVSCVTDGDDPSVVPEGENMIFDTDQSCL